MKLSVKRRNILFILGICILVAAYIGVNWYMDPYRGLGEVSEVELTSFPQEIVLSDVDGGAGGIVFHLRLLTASDSVSYVYDRQSRFAVEKYVDGNWYSVNSQDPSGHSELPPAELHEGRNAITVTWDSALRSGIYRMIVTVNELQDGTYSTSYTEAALFAV